MSESVLISDLGFGATVTHARSDDVWTPTLIQGGGMMTRMGSERLQVDTALLSSPTCRVEHTLTALDPSLPQIMGMATAPVLGMGNRRLQSLPSKLASWISFCSSTVWVRRRDPRVLVELEQTNQAIRASHDYTRVVMSLMWTRTYVLMCVNQR